MTTPAVRSPSTGVRQIFAYNRSFYLATVAGLAAAFLLSLFLPSPFGRLLSAAASVALFWLSSSLLVSHVIYDRSGLYESAWLRRVLQNRPQRWIQIHAGLDETSELLAAAFPAAEERVVDIYDPREMTEPSISRARRLNRQYSVPSDFRRLPAATGEFDAAFLIFAAHELRRTEHRVLLFGEIGRALKSEGELVLVEHLRDWKNFLAFGPGFLHFFSARSWKHDAGAAAFRLKRQATLTPFVRIFVFGKLK
jgi:SAM-dependent methyltransferase